MAGFTGTSPIVTDGLVFAVDAANYESYPGSGTTWNDLSGNGNNGTLTNGPTFDSGNGGSIQFDGTNDYVDFGNINTDLHSLNTWVHLPNTITSTSPRISLMRIDSGAQSNLVTGASTGYAVDETLTLLWSETGVGGYKRNYIKDEIPSGWNLISIQWNSSNLAYNFYLNGGQKTSYLGTGGGVGLLEINNLQIGRNSPENAGTGNNFEGKNSLVFVYNRALTSKEISQNYNALKSRFNLD